MTENPQNKKRKKNYYFTKVHEEAIVKYASTNDNKIRTELYIEYVQPAFLFLREERLNTTTYQNT